MWSVNEDRILLVVREMDFPIDSAKIEMEMR
jgi:hypothetical protein